MAFNTFGVPKSMSDVAAYLVEEYEMNSLAAWKICETYPGIYDEGVQLGSFTYYIGDEMYKADKAGEAAR